MNLIFIGHDISSKIYFKYLILLKIITEFFWNNKKIYFLKKIERDEIVDAYKRSDIFLFTSRIECSPLVIFESAAAGLPFFSLKVGNTEEISS